MAIPSYTFKEAQATPVDEWVLMKAVYNPSALEKTSASYRRQGLGSLTDFISYINMEPQLFELLPGAKLPKGPFVSLKSDNTGEILAIRPGFLIGKKPETPSEYLPMTFVEKIESFGSIGTEVIDRLKGALNQTQKVSDLSFDEVRRIKDTVVSDTGQDKWTNLQAKRSSMPSNGTGWEKA